MYDAISDTSVILLRHIVSSALVLQYKMNILSVEDIMDATKTLDNYLSRNKLLVGILSKSKANLMLENGNISETD